MRIESDIKLDFSDVLLKPKRSTLTSRKDVDLNRIFKFRWTEWTWTGVPIISSNMTSVTNPDVAKIMRQHKMLSCIPKNQNLANYGNYHIESIGLNDKPLSSRLNWLCLDVPNGYIEEVVERTRELRRLDSEGVIIVGNVVTAEQTEALILAGADIVKVGIGSGAACSTRIKTGVGMPQLSAVMECADAAHGLSGHVISDGGCTTAGDIVKAFAAGADFVMLGGMLAGHTENQEKCSRCNGKCEEFGKNGVNCTACNGTGKVGAFYGMSSKRGNEELAGGIKDYRASEGWEIKLPDRGPIDGTLQDIEGGLRSACTYIGARSLKDLPKCATFVMVNRQANSSLWEHRI